MDLYDLSIEYELNLDLLSDIVSDQGTVSQSFGLQVPKEGLSFDWKIFQIATPEMSFILKLQNLSVYMIVLLLKYRHLTGTSAET